MLYIAAVLLILALVYLVITVPYLTLDLRLENKQLTVLLKTWFYKKTIVSAPSKTKDSDTEGVDSTAETEADSGGGASSPISEKIKEIKSRVFEPETGFNTDEARSVYGELSYLISLLRRFFGSMRYKIQIPTLRITLDFGTGNAASTGMLYGTIWGAAGILFPILARYTRTVFPMIDITPDYYSKRFDIKAKSIIKVRPVHIINAAIPAAISLGLSYLKSNSKKEVKYNGRKTSD